MTRYLFGGGQHVSMRIDLKLGLKHTKLSAGTINYVFVFRSHMPTCDVT